MAKIYTDDWCRIEGMVIPDIKETYGHEFTSIPSGTNIYYGAPEIQIFNKRLLLNGIVYKVVSISELSGFTDMTAIDEGYTKLQNDIQAYDKTVVLDDTANSAQYYYEPFVVDESSVIFYDDSTSTLFSKYAIIYVDKYAAPTIVTVSAKYIGNPVPLGDKYDLNDILLNVIYSDGNTARVKEGFTTTIEVEENGTTTEKDDQIIAKIGANIVKVTYTTPGNVQYETKIIIEGIKKLVSITAIYDGPSLSDGQEVSRKYLKVIAQYSDNSSATVTDYVFPNGNRVSTNNRGIIAIVYHGKTVDVNIPMYEVTSSRLIAYYTGPNIEINHDFDTTKTDIRIYYQSNDAANSFYEKVDSSFCTFTPTTIDHDGVNQISVYYTGKKGTVSTKMIVVGIKPEVHMTFIEAEYTGPEIVQGKSYSPERVIVKAHFSDGTIVTVKNGFRLSGNIVEHIGLNEFKVTYKNKDDECTTTFSVKGLPKDDTTESNYNPIYLDNNYPEATKRNNRYRGPAEGNKHDSISYDLYTNINNLYKLYYDIEADYNDLVKQMENNDCIKIVSLNSITKIESGTKEILNDTRFSTGKYVQEV